MSSLKTLMRFIVCIEVSTTLKKHHPLFFAKFLCLKSTNCASPPPFRQFPPYTLVFREPPPKNWVFLVNPHNFSSLTPSHLLKVTKFLVKTSQFKFLIMTEKTFLFINSFCR